MDDPQDEMARRFYGYGRWNAPYWFIGPEQGMSRRENNDINLWAEAWKELGSRDLNDCREFLHRIGEMRFHFRDPVALQSTWRPLMMLLMAFLKMPTDTESLRAYQRDRWGSLTGETCVIELSGLPANNSKVPRERELFRQERIETICHKMHTYKPALVVMYGKKDQKHWEQIAGRMLVPDSVQKLGSTMITFTRHPNNHGRKNADWSNLGERLRLEFSGS